MRLSPYVLSLGSLVLVLSAGQSLSAADPVDPQQLVASSEAGVVRLTMRQTTVWQRGGDNEQRYVQEFEYTGAVLDEEGLIVASIPGSNRNPWLRGGNRVGVSMATGTSTRVSRAGRSSEVTVTLRMGDAELALTEVAHDSQTSLSFYRPTEAGQTFKPVALPAQVPALALLDEVLVLGRLDTLIGAAPSLVHASVSAVVPAGETGGESVYHLDLADATAANGGLVLRPDGQVLGLLYNGRRRHEERRHTAKLTVINPQAAIDAALERGKKELEEARAQATEAAAEAVKAKAEAEASEKVKSAAGPMDGF